MNAAYTTAWSAEQHPEWCVPDGRGLQGCHMLGRGGHLSPTAVAGHPASGELRAQLAQMQSRHHEQTLVVVEASAAGQTTVLWLTVDEWRDLVVTVDGLVAHDHKSAP